MKSSKKISRIITVRLFVAVFAAFIISSLLTYFLLLSVSEREAYDLVQQSTYDVSCDLMDKATEYIVTEYSSLLAEYHNDGADAFRQKLENDQSRFSYITDNDGIILIAGIDEYIGRDVHDIEEVGDAVDGIYKVGVTEGVSTVGNITSKPVTSLDGETQLYYIVLSLYDGTGFFVAAITQEYYDEIIAVQGQFIASNRHIGHNGFNIIVDSQKRIISTPNDELFLQEIPHFELNDEFNNENSTLIKRITYPGDQSNGSADTVKNYINGMDLFWDTEYYYSITSDNGVYFTYSLYPVSEARDSLYTTMMFTLIIEIVVFSVLFFTMHLLIKRTVVRKLDSVNHSLGEITQGNLDVKVEVRDSFEFDMLSTDINATVDRLKEYIAEAAARIDADLAVAKAIQSSALPTVFPPFPERKEFELYASMKAAKEVGGDFYDFYMLNNDTLGFLIADVSGKSIPGAMFMMTAKTVIKSLAESGLPPAEVFTLANEKLCEGNEAEMFVTAWLGYLDLKTGVVHVANAGHNPPVLIRDGKAEYVILKPGLMLAGMDGVRYKEQTVQLQKGDILYLYTDGVTEAMDTAEELYGEDRLQRLLSFGENYPEPSADNGIVEPVCSMVSEDLAKYTAGAEQSDDITMLCIRYLGGN
ncbi:MAG: SpoIIE family protein phosphatase [Ruminiclostridium sp.]